MSRFRTSEISESRFESDNLHFMTVKTPNLKGRGDICIFEPPNVRDDQTLSVVILLHGVYGSAWNWAYNTGIHLKANEMINRGELPPMVLAMPSDGLWGDGSAYLPHDGYDFEKWIALDVIDAVEEKIAGVQKHSPLFIAGLSMGGFGALRIGAKYGFKFKGIAGHSSITNLQQMKLFVEEDISGYQQEDPVDNDIFKTFQRFRGQLPPVRFDCGSNDQLIEHNRMLHRQMQDAGIEHVYEEHPGGHEWSYWAEHIVDTLRFFAKQIKQ
ncbi:MAG: alpha/beta hydrolase-fold protein [Cyclobacteriaceae bacterium]